jgi:hypothetical protein
MTSYDGGPRRDPLDPDFEGLFRPEDVAPPAPAPDEAPAPPAWDEVDDEPHFESVMDPVVDPRVEEELHAHEGEEPGPALQNLAQPPQDPIADTGRLFRSQGVAGHHEAVLALSSDHYGRLRTLERRNETGPVVVDAAPIIVTGTSLDEEADMPVANPAKRSRLRRERPDRAAQGHRSGITGGAVYIIVIGVTLLVGFANALLADGDIGWPTGLALLVSSVYAALTVRRSDDTVAMIVPPLAFVVTALTAGQLFLGSAEGSILNRAVVVFFSLADNWIWIIGATVAALVIVLVRRRRG